MKRYEGVTLPYEVADAITLQTLKSVKEMLLKPPFPTHPEDIGMEQQAMAACDVLIKYFSVEGDE